MHVSHGEEDLNAPFIAHGKVLAEKLPKADAKFYRRAVFLSQGWSRLKIGSNTGRSHHIPLINPPGWQARQKFVMR